MHRVLPRRRLGPFGPELSVIGASVRADRPVDSHGDALRSAADAGVDWVVVADGRTDGEWVDFALACGLTVFLEISAGRRPPALDSQVAVLIRPTLSLAETLAAWARLAQESGRFVGLTTRRADLVDRCQRIRPVDVVRAGPLTTLASGVSDALLFDCRWSGTAVLGDLHAGSHLDAAADALARRRATALLAPPDLARRLHVESLW